MKTTAPYLALTLLLLAGAAWTGCSESKPEPESAPRVENSSLDIAIAAVPAPFVVGTNEGSVLELRAPGQAAEARLFFETTGEMSSGINLVAEAEGMRDWFEQQPEGQYFGNLELGTPLGPAFTSRGSYALDGVMVEEIRVFAIHPVSNRLLRLTYRYEPGEGKERLQQLAEVLGEVEGLYGTNPDASSAGPDN
jgi:hypothetical protein